MNALGKGFGWLSLVLLVVGMAEAEAGAGRGFEIADHYRIAMVGAPSLSGDGQLLAFSVRRYELAKAETWSEIWTMRIDGSRLRQMTFGRHEDSSPVFSPDGARLIFVSDRGAGSEQLFVMALDGGEARQLTSFPLGLSDPVWSPDGRWIAVTCAVYPECGADSECNETLSASWSQGPLQAHLADELLYRHWSSWRDGKFRHILLLDSTSGEVVRDLSPGRWDSPTFSLGGAHGYAFSPDSQQLCYVSNHDHEPARSTNTDLWLVPVAGSPGAVAINISADNLGSDGDPCYSPDGRFIAFRRQLEAGYESGLFLAAVYDRETGTVRQVTDGSTLSNWVDALAWSPDSRALYLQVPEQGRNPIYRLDLSSGSLERALLDGHIDGWQLSPDGKTILYSRRTVGEPAEIFQASLASGSEPVRLTDFNRALLAEVDFRPAEELWVEVGKRQVHVFLVKPHGFDPNQQYPLILNVHGGPQMQWSDSYRGDWQVYPGRGYVVAFANPTGSTGYGQELVDAIACDWGGQVYQDLEKVTDTLAELPFVDAERIGAMGWSYGGYMMMWFAGHTQRYQALASMMGVYDLGSMYGGTEELWFIEHDLCGTPWTSEHYRRWSPSQHVEAFATPTLVITGEKDYRVPYTQSLQFFTDLQRKQVPSRLLVLPAAGHWPGWYEMAFYYLAHLDWFHQWLGGEPAPWDLESFLRNQVFEPSEPSQN